MSLNLEPSRGVVQISALMTRLNDLREQGRMTWNERTRGWLGTLSEIVGALEGDGFCGMQPGGRGEPARPAAGRRDVAGRQRPDGIRGLGDLGRSSEGPDGDRLHPGRRGMDHAAGPGPGRGGGGRGLTTAEPPVVADQGNGLMAVPLRRLRPA